MIRRLFFSAALAGTLLGLPVAEAMPLSPTVGVSADAKIEKVVIIVKKVVRRRPIRRRVIIKKVIVH